MKENKTPINLVLSTEEVFAFLRDQMLLNDAIECVSKMQEYQLVTSESFLNQILAGQNRGKQSDTFVESETEVSDNSLMPIKVNLKQFRFTRSHAENGFSNGYLDYILRREFQRLKATGVKKCQKKNKNHMEFDLELSDGTIYKFAYVYGFKNIQNVIMQVKSKRCKYLYCEVMACPSGCLNGGGQIRYEGEQQRTDNLESLFGRLDSRDFVEHQSQVQSFIDHLNSGSIAHFIAKPYFNYKIEEIKQTDPLKLNW